MGTYVPPASAQAPPSRVREFLGSVVSDAVDWADEGRSALVRAPLLVYLAYVFVRHVFNTRYFSLFDWFTVPVHELGHVVLRFGGEFVGVAGGTIFQLGFPLVAMFMFLRQRDYFAVTVGSSWLSYNMYTMATYIADSREMKLDYVTVGGGGEGIHDWDYMLTAFGLLEHDKQIAFLVRVVAFFVGVASIAAGAALVAIMAKSRNTPKITD